jgi:hypothetical protein
MRIEITGGLWFHELDSARWVDVARHVEALGFEPFGARSSSVTVQAPEAFERFAANVAALGERAGLA